jgi:molecular chaperone HscB
MRAAAARASASDDGAAIAGDALQASTKAARPPCFLMDIQDNHFAFFGFPERFALDRAGLDRAYREVQTQVHPDRFARAGATEQRVALQWATKANEAYRVLREPLSRAVYLCTLRGIDPADERDTRMAGPFLIQQLEWREALDAARSGGDAAAGAASIAALRGELDATRDRLQAETAAALDAGDTAAAVERVRQWMFVERFGEDVAAASRQSAAAAAVH